jgi:hypothetical protein
MLVKQSTRIIFVGPEETLVLERIVTDIVFFLCRDGMANLRRCGRGGNADLHYYEVGSPPDRFYIAFDTPGAEMGFGSSTYPQLLAIKPCFIMMYVAQRVAQLTATMGYFMNIETRQDGHHGWLFITTTRND